MNNNIIRNGNGTEYKDLNRVSRVQDCTIESERINPEMNAGMIFENKIAPVWASTKVAATILGISANALRIRKCRGEVQCRYFGKHLRFDIPYLQSLIRVERTQRKE